MSIKKNISALFVFSFCVVHAEIGRLSFEDALEAAYFNNKEWRAEQTDKKAADEKYKMSKMMFLPDVGARIGTSRSKKHTKVNHDGTTLDYDASFNTGTSMGITLRQNLFNGFTTINSMKASEFESNAAFHKLRENEQKLIIKVLDSYAKVWFSVRKVEALKKKEENLHKTLLSQQTSLEAGIVTQSEVSSAKADYHRAVFERISAETDLFSAEAEFEKITGLKARKDVELPVLELNLPNSLDKLIELALSSNNSIISAKFVEKSALKELDATRGKLSPSCDLELQTAKDLSKEREVSSYNRRINTYVASLQVNVPIFSNTQGNTYSQIEIANQRALNAKFKAEDAVLEVKKECVKNWNIYVATDALIKSSKTAVQSNELNSESLIEQTALGMKSNTDVWVRENQLMESRISLAESQMRRITASVNLLMLTGELSMHFLLGKIKKASNKSKNKKR